MKSEFCISRQGSSKLREQIVLVERQCWSNCQYSRRECLEPSGLLESIENSELEGTALRFLKSWMSKQAFSILRIVTGYQVKGQKEFIVKFPKRKDANRIRKIKKNLKGIDLSSFGIRSTLYINDSLCKYYKMLWQKCKKLCVNKFIHTAQKMKFSIRDFLSKCDQICRKLLRTCNKWKHCGISSIVILLRKQ